MGKQRKAALCALLAAALYGVNIPLSKLLLGHIAPVMTAALLYLGAGLGMLGLTAAGGALGRPVTGERLTKKELPYTLAMIALDIAAPILLMLGVERTSAANASLLGGFEIVATALVALLLFKEVVSKRLWLAILLVSAASALRGIEGTGALAFNEGSLLVLGACVCWGFENNCTRMMSTKSSVEIVHIKGCCSGAGSMLSALIVGESFPDLIWALAAMALGFVSYGLSINFYILAQKELGAAKTSAYYSIAPFLGVGFSLLLLGERPGARFYIALAIMALGVLLTARDTIALQHTHEHSHGGRTHTHAHTHERKAALDDAAEHSHSHTTK